MFLRLRDRRVEAARARALERQIPAIRRSVDPVVPVRAEQQLHVRDQIFDRRSCGRSTSSLRHPIFFRRAIAPQCHRSGQLQNATVLLQERRKRSGALVDRRAKISERRVTIAEADLSA